MSTEHVCPCAGECPLQKAMNTIGGKWKLSIICLLTTHGATRYNNLRRRLKGISNTMLVKSLKELEDDGLIRRREYLEVPVRVEYETTEKTGELLPILMSLAQWGSNLPGNAP